MREPERGFREALSTRLRRRWFLYLAVSVFYCLDIYLTLLVWGRGPFQESNPVSKYVLAASGPGGWVAFRFAMLFVTTMLLLLAFALATVRLGNADGIRDIDRVEEIALGSVVLFYAVTLMHNLMAISAPFPHPA